MEFFGSDWQEVFATDLPIFELFVRATVLYFAVFIILRSTLRRSAGELRSTPAFGRGGTRRPR